MDVSLGLRLKAINDAVESLIGSGREVLTKLIENSVTLEEARVSANKLKAMNDRFVSEMYNYFKLVQVPSADEVSGYTAIQIQAEELVAEIEVRAQVLKQSGAVHISTSNANMSSRLPQMELARFDGDILRWHQFWDQFSSNVDSRNINDVDKLLYLKSVLDGEAKQAIDGLDTTSTNYKIAVETLKERYGKQATIIDAHYRALFRIQVATSSIKECRNNLSAIERHLRVLSSLGENVNHNHFRVMILEKFPEDLVYVLLMKMGPEEESMENIRKGLEYIISAKELSNRLKGEITKDDKFTLDALHVRSDDINRGRQLHVSRVSDHRVENKQKFNGKRFSQAKSGKRSRDEATRQTYEPRLKKLKLVCIFCERNHFNDECLNVKSLHERRLKIKGRCYNCFGKGHRAIDCKNKKMCRHCGKFGLHNRALCPDKVDGQTNATKVLHVNVVKGLTVLQTGVVNAYKVGNMSHYVNCRVLLDCGSQRSYVTSKIAKELALPVIEDNCLSVFTFGAKTAQEFESPVINFNMVTRTNVSRVIYANVVPHISQNVPCPYGNMQNVNDILKSYKGLVLADDGSREKDVDILLGNDYFHYFMSNDKIEVANDLFLVKSDFGWVWSGKYSVLTERDNLSVLTYIQNNKHIERSFYEPDLPLRNESLKQLWDLEAIGITDCPKVSRDEEAVKKFNETTKYHENRYYVKWPWTEYPPIQLPINLGLAKGRLVNLLKRLDFKTIKAYDRVLKDQLQMGIIEKIDSSRLPDDHPVHYLPHHCVQQAGKSTKLRIVYDASAKSKDNCSLNECLYRGPLMLEDLTGLIIRFREHLLGIVADVEKAFLQIGLQDSDRDVTRFLWIKDINKDGTVENLQHLRFCRVPFGVISSPFLLNAAVRYHLIKSGNTINKTIADEIYVDNLVTGEHK